MRPITRIELTPAELVAKTGVTYPNIPPHDNIAVLMAAWNEQRRIGRLLKLCQTWFSRVVVAVQASDDQTLQIAQRMARDSDQILEHLHMGHGDASMPDLIKHADRPWCLALALDERPSKGLLESVGSAVALGDEEGHDAYWLKFVSITEGVRSRDTQAGHLRLFRQELDWPGTMHSRPTGHQERWWPFGYITHRRSLDEMMRDYLRIYRLGSGNAGWKAHNRLMMHDACMVIAEHYGWGKVMAYEWWPEVRALAFSEEEIP